MYSKYPKTRFLLNWGLVALLLASCAPAAATVEAPPPVAPVIVEPSVTPFLSVEPTLAQNNGSETVIIPTETLAPTPFPIATSRGPNLEATDPRTVNLASGGLQFVEFFRFT